MTERDARVPHVAYGSVLTGVIVGAGPAGRAAC